MLHRLLSGDLPRSHALTVALGGVLVSLAFAPFLFPGSQSLNVAASAAICISALVSG